MPNPLITHRVLSASGGGVLSDRAAQFGGMTKVTAQNGGAFAPPNSTGLTVAFWISLDEAIGASAWEVLNVAGAAVETDGWYAYVEGTTQKIGMGYSNGVSYNNLTPLALTENTWYMILCYWDNDASPNLTMDVYDTTALINSFSTAGNGFINVASPQPLNIGGGVGGQAWMKGRLDKVGIWLGNKSSSSATIWNNGAGLTGNQLAPAGLLSDLAGWYDLDERSGAATWADFLGAHDAAATGNVLSVPRSGQF